MTEDRMLDLLAAQKGEVYVPLELTDSQREQIQAAERAATEPNQPPPDYPNHTCLACGVTVYRREGLIRTSATDSLHTCGLC